MHTKILYSILVACALIIPTTVFADNTVQPGVPFQLGFNQTATIQDLQIKIVNITDSRCPSDVTCVWQGQAKILVNVGKNGQDSGNLTLTTLNDKKQTIPSFDQYYIELMKVDPYPVSDKKIQLSDYIITLKLSLFSPLKQFRSGISQVTCMQDLVLVTKLDNSPACVKPQTATKLVQRGWAHSGTTPNLESDHGQNQIVTLEQSGQIIHLNKGDSFLLKLGKDYDWNISIDNQTILSRAPNIMVVEGAQGIFVAHNIGTVKLSAVGDPWCLKSTTPCKIHSILFEVNVVVISGANSEMANPASTYCINHGGTLEIRTDDAGQHGICVFHNG